MIINKINNKAYVGNYGEKPYGINGRFKTHLYNAINSVETYKNHNDCPKLYNAQKKSMEEKFKIICDFRLYCIAAENIAM